MQGMMSKTKISVSSMPVNSMGIYFTKNICEVADCVFGTFESLAILT